MEQIVRRNAIVYRCATPDPAQALLFGNGAMGGSVHTPDDSLYLLIGRGDIWSGENTMGAIAAVRVRGYAGLFANAKTVRQECNLYEANIRIQADDMTFTITCLRGRDVVVVDVGGPQQFGVPPLGGSGQIPPKGGTPNALTVTIENWHTGDETTATETVHVNRASVFAEMNRKVGLEPAQVPVADPLLGRAWGLFVEVCSQARSEAECRPGESAGRATDATPSAFGGLRGSLQTPEAVYPGYKLHPPRAATRAGHWHDESTGHGQVGLAEDGLFPATRGATR